MLDDLLAQGGLDARELLALPVVASSRRPPQQAILVLFVRRPPQSCVGGPDVHPDDIVRGPAPTPRQVAEPPTQGESRDAGERDESEDGSEPVHLRFAIHVTEQATS